MEIELQFRGEPTIAVTGECTSARRRAAIDAVVLSQQVAALPASHLRLVEIAVNRVSPALAGSPIRYSVAVLYRLYQPDDFAALYAIEETCFQPPLRFPTAYMQQLVASPAAATWIAQDQDGMTGFGIVEWSSGELGIEAYIQTLEVAPQNRSQGIGRELLRRLEASAQTAGAVLIWLHVDAENGLAIRLYESNHYQYQGREENYYAHRPAYLYAKSLPSAEPVP